MKKGIVMEVNSAYLTLLTTNGEFLHTVNRNPTCTIGEEISFFPIEKPIRKNHFSIIKVFKYKPLPVSFVILFLLLGSFIPMYQTNKAYAYMSIDVNPSLELGLNKKMQVVSLSGFNQDGKKIISQITDWKKEKVSQLTQEILKEMNKQGYLKENHAIIISTVRIDTAKKQVEDKLTKDMNKIKEIVKENHLQLTMLTGTEKEMGKAHHLGLTTGKYQERKMFVPAKDPSINLNLKPDHVKKNIDKSIPQLNQQPSQLKKNQGSKRIVQNQEQTEKRLNKHNKNYQPLRQMKKPKVIVDEHKGEKQHHVGTRGIMRNPHANTKTQHERHLKRQRNNEFGKKHDKNHGEHY